MSRKISDNPARKRVASFNLPDASPGELDVLRTIIRDAQEKGLIDDYEIVCSNDVKLERDLGVRLPFRRACCQ